MEAPMSALRSFLSIRRAKGFGRLRNLSGPLRSAIAELRRFRRDEGGNLVIIGGVTLPIAVMAVGAAGSFSGGNATRTSMQSALDAAGLAGLGESHNLGEIIHTAQRDFPNNPYKVA